MKKTLLSIIAFTTITACGAEEFTDIEGIQSEERAHSTQKLHETDVFSRDGMFMSNESEDVDCDNSALEATRIELQSVEGGHNFTCGLDMDNRAVCFGRNKRFDYSKVHPTEQFKSLHVMSDYFCGITFDDKLRCFGEENGVTEYVPNGEFVDFGAYMNDYHSSDWMACGLRTNGQVKCWLGERDMSPRGYFKSIIQPTNVVNQVIGCGLTFDDQIKCWNTEGKEKRYPFVEKADAFRDVKASEYGVCGLSKDGDIHCTIDDRIHPQQSFTLEGNFKRMSLAWSRVCAIDTYGKLKCYYPSEYKDHNVIDAKELKNYRDGYYVNVISTIHAGIFAQKSTGEITYQDDWYDENSIVESQPLFNLTGKNVSNVCGIVQDSGGIFCQGDYTNRYEEAFLYVCE